MDQLRIVDSVEYWITWENGYGQHDVVQKLYSEELARGVLPIWRDRGGEDRYEVQRVTIRKTAEKLDW